MKKYLALSLLLISNPIHAQTPVSELKPLINNRLAPSASSDRAVTQNMKDVTSALANQIIQIDSTHAPVMTISKIRGLTTTTANGPASIITTDNGGGTFVMDKKDTSSPDNTGTVLVTKSGLRFKRKGVITIESFGATPNDGTDDAAAITKALNYFATNGRTLIIGDGIYDTSLPLTVLLTNRTGALANQAGRRMVIKGAGANNTIIRYTGTATVTVLNIIGAKNGQDNFYIEGLRIIPTENHANQRKSSGLLIRNLANFKIKDVQVAFFDLGINLLDAGEGALTEVLTEHNNRGFYAAPDKAGIAPNGILFTSCGFNSNLQYGAFILNGCTNTFKGCRVLQNGSDKNGRGIKIQYVSYNGGVSANIEGCYIESNKGVDVEIVSASGGAHNIVGNTFNKTGKNHTSEINLLFTPLNLVYNDGKLNQINLKANSFVSYDGYIPDAGKHSVFFGIGPNNYNGWIVDDNSYYQNNIEAPVFSDNVKSKFVVNNIKVNDIVGIAALGGVLDLTGHTEKYYYLTNQAATTINSIVGASTGMEIMLQADNRITLQHNKNHLFAGQANFTFSPGQVITLYKQIGNWREINRSANVAWQGDFITADVLFSGSSATTYSFKHGLTSMPSWYSVTATSPQAVATPYWLSATATVININFVVAPIVDKNNLSFKVAYRR